MTERQIIRSERKAKLIDMLGEVCADCGTTDDLQFDHVNEDRQDPTYHDSATISHMIDGPWDKLIDEIRKCQLLCIGCHAKKSMAYRWPTLPPHGSYSRYVNQKCRCDDCRKANARYKLEHKRSR